MNDDIEPIWAITVTRTAHLIDYNGGIRPMCWTPGVRQAIEAARAVRGTVVGRVDREPVCKRCINTLANRISAENELLGDVLAHNGALDR